MGQQWREEAVQSINALPLRYREWPEVRGRAWEDTEMLRGTIQRVDYQRQEVRVIAEGRVWQIVLSVDCQLWFNDTPAILRCFHPLDSVTVLYQDQDTDHVLKAIYAWEA
jgi:hypothetical protein